MNRMNEIGPVQDSNVGRLPDDDVESELFESELESLESLLSLLDVLESRLRFFDFDFFLRFFERERDDSLRSTTTVLRF